MTIRLPSAFRSLVLGACLASAALVPAPSAFAFSQSGDGAQIVVAANAYGGQRRVEVELNKSIIIDLPAGVAEVIASQPNVAAAIMRTRTRAIVQGVQEGTTNIIFIDDAGRTIQVLDVVIIQPPLEIGRALEDTLARVIPGSNIKVETLANNSVNDKIYFVLTGTVLTAEDKVNAEAMANALADGEGEGSLIQVIGPQQVMLQVTVSEIRRNVAQQLGINLSGTVTLPGATLGINSAQTATANGVTGAFNIGNTQINAAIKALEARGALRLLAQPTLTAMSGNEATFLVGGEFPIPVLNDNGTTTITYKDYGVQLDFMPVVKSNGSIALTVKTGVSEVQPDGFALSRRDVSTMVELPAGSTLAIGGLLSEKVNQDIDQLPALGNIPILGALFRSRDFRREETELVVLVTPYLVNPSPANTVPVPTDFSQPASDAEAIFLGKLENQYGVGQGGMRGGFSGSVGFVLD